MLIAISLFCFCFFFDAHAMQPFVVPFFHIPIQASNTPFFPQFNQAILDVKEGNFIFILSLSSSPLCKPLIARPHAIDAAHLQRVLLVLVAPAEAAVERAGLPGGRVADGGLAGGGGVLGVEGLRLLGCRLMFVSIDDGDDGDDDDEG